MDSHPEWLAGGKMKVVDTSERFHGADFLRAAACMIVFLHHVAQHIPFDDTGNAFRLLEPFALMGGYGVAIFFVLSGFLLSAPFWKALGEGRAMPDLKVYFLRRMARIAPAFWLALTVSFLVAALVFGAPFGGGSGLRYLAGMSFLASLHWFTMLPVELNGPLWSVSFEVAAYAIMPVGFLPVFAMARRRRGRGGLLAAWVGVILLSLALHLAYVNFVGLGEPLDIAAVKATPFWFVYLGHYWYPEYNPLGFFCIFAIGVFASGMHQLSSKRQSWLFDALFAASVGATAVMLWSNTEEDFDKFWHLPFAKYPELPLLVGIILIAGARSSFAARAIEFAIVRYLSRISFGIYLWHLLIMALVTRYVYPEYRPFFDMTTDATVLILAPSLVFVASLVIASASWRWLERPAIQWARGKEAFLAAAGDDRIKEPPSSLASDLP